jgi:calcineurin-like phosphoesterase family protein
MALGNHDFRMGKMDFWSSVGFAEVYRFPVCIKKFVWLSHEPMYMNKNMPYINIHGHLHRNKISNPNKELYVNVSVELLDYTLVLLTGLIPKDVESENMKEITSHYDNKRRHICGIKDE